VYARFHSSLITHYSLLALWRVWQHTLSPLSPFVSFEFKNRRSLCQFRHLRQLPTGSSSNRPSVGGREIDELDAISPIANGQQPES